MSVGLETQNPNHGAYGLGSLINSSLTKRTAELGDVFDDKDIFGLSHRGGKRRTLNTIANWPKPASP
jgi:hypothetical protein